MTKNAIEKTPSKKLTKKQLRQLASFTDPGTVLATLSKEGWTIEESIQHLVSIAKGEDGTKTSTQLNAIRYLNQLVIDAMERSGMMIMASKKYVGEDGEEVRFSGHVVSSVLRGQKEQTTPAELTTDVIEKEDDNGNERSEDGEDGEDEGNKEGKERSQESSLSTSKPPTGREAKSGHFKGVAERSKGDPNENKSGDFI